MVVKALGRLEKWRKAYSLTSPGLEGSRAERELAGLGLDLGEGGAEGAVWVAVNILLYTGHGGGGGAEAHVDQHNQIQTSLCSRGPTEQNGTAEVYTLKTPVQPLTGFVNLGGLVPCSGPQFPPQ